MACSHSSAFRMAMTSHRSFVACVCAVDVVEARLIELCRPSSSSGSLECRIGRFMFIDQLCRMIGILETFIRIFVGCLATFEVNRLGRLVLTLPLGLWCVGRIDSFISDSRYGNFAFSTCVDSVLSLMAFSSSESSESFSMPGTTGSTSS